MPSPELPAPAPVEPLPAGPRCTACGEPALVHWLRRPTDEELAEVVAAEQDRREQIRLLADPQLPAPGFRPPPTADDTTRIVFACGPHAITLDGASLTHASSCTAPNDADLPDCDCTPETPPKAPPEEPPAMALPDHWLPAGGA